MILINVIAILLALAHLSGGTGFGSVWPKIGITAIYQLCLNQRTVCFYEPDHCYTAGESSCEKMIVLTNYRFARALLNHDNPHNSPKSDQVGLFLFGKVDGMNRDDRSVVAALTQEVLNNKRQHKIYHIRKCDLVNLKQIIQVDYLKDNLFTDRTGQRSVQVDVNFTKTDYFGCSWTYSYSDIKDVFSSPDLQVLAVDSLTVSHDTDVKFTYHHKGRAHVASDGFISATDHAKPPLWAMILAGVIVVTVLGAFIHSGYKRLRRWRQIKRGQVLSNVAMPMQVLPVAGQSTGAYSAPNLMAVPSLTSMTAMPSMTINSYPPNMATNMTHPPSPYLGQPYPPIPSAPQHN